MISISPSQDDVYNVLTAFLTAIMPAGMPIVRGQENRVPQPRRKNQIVLWPLRLPRIMTNIDDYEDCAFTAAIADDTMTVSAVLPGYPEIIAVGSTIFGPLGAIDAATIVTELGTGEGGVGTYTVTPSQTVTSQTLAAGRQEIMQAGEVVMQIDVHGPRSWDNAQKITTLLRDPFATEFFKTSFAAGTIAPLYTEDATQAPFPDGEQQTEDRYMVVAHLEANQTIIVPQQFADQLEADGIDVDAAYPAS